jgi:hypothetical protein
MVTFIGCGTWGSGPLHSFWVWHLGVWSITLLLGLAPWGLAHYTLFRSGTPGSDPLHSFWVWHLGV